MSQESNVSDFLNGKPSIASVAPSALLSRLRTFLPQMEEANRHMPEGDLSDAFQIEKNIEKEDESSDSSDDSSDDDDDDEDKLEETEDSMEIEGNKVKFAGRIEIDLDVLREPNSRVDYRDVSVQDVDTLPDAFQPNNDIVEQEQSPKKPLIEEL